MWPIPGPNLYDSVRAFLTEKLGLGASFVAEMGVFFVERHCTPKNPLKLEALVRFEMPNKRDAVKAASINLAGKPAGMMIEVPIHLRAGFRHLDNLCFELKKKHPRLKRSI